jgi:MFS family permease
LVVICLKKRTSTEDNRPNSGASGQNKAPGFFYGYYIVIAALFIYIMMWGSRLSFGVFIGPLLDEFHWSRASTSAGFSATWILTGLLAIFVGRLNDRFGPRIIMTVAGCFLGLGYFLISTIHSEWQLYAYYLIVNIGMSAALVPTMSTVARWFVKRRALMSGIVLSGTGIALMVISPVANALILSFGWRPSYVIVSVSALVIIVLSAQFLKRDPFKIGKLPYGYSEAKKNTLDSISVGINMPVYILLTMWFSLIWSSMPEDRAFPPSLQ